MDLEERRLLAGALRDFAEHDPAASDAPAGEGESAEPASAARAPEEEEVEGWITQALPYVPSVARRYLGCGLPFEELLAAGNLGLVEAALRFDAARNVKFVTYADWWIRKAILSAIEEQIGPVRLPRYRLEQLRMLHDARASLRHRGGEEPEPEDIATATGLPPEEVRQLLAMGRQSVSLEQPATAGSDLPLRDTISADAAQGPQTLLLKDDTARRLRRLVASLEERERGVLVLRYGLAGAAPLTLREVGRRMGISRERVRQIEHRALHHLRRML